MALFVGLESEAGAAAGRRGARAGRAGRCSFRGVSLAPKGKRVAPRSAAEKRRTWETHPIGHS